MTKHFFLSVLAMAALSTAVSVPAIGSGHGEGHGKGEGEAGHSEGMDNEKEASHMVDNIHWLGHDTFRIDGKNMTVYTDPYKISGGKAAGLILLTHSHQDHCSPEDVKKIQGPETVIVATADCADKLSGNIKTMKPGDSLSVGDVRIEAVPSYNTNKNFHPKENGWAGYIFTVDGVRIYLAGDTDLIPEMKAFACDVALLPVSGTYVMTAEEAVRAALDINPQIAIPMHYGTIVGTLDDAQAFKRALEGKVRVEVLEKQQ